MAQVVPIDSVSFLIQQIGKIGFTQSLIAFLRTQIKFDSVVVVGVNETRRPVYLYDDLEKDRGLLFNQYLMGFYQDDPFYQGLMHGELQEGVYSLAELITKSCSSVEYLNSFYEQTGWYREIGIILNISTNRWVIVFLGYLTPIEERFFRTEQSTMRGLLPLVTALVRQHWGSEPFMLSSATREQGLSRWELEECMDSFLQDRLTSREVDVTKLILQGLDSREIAQHLQITEGTVKNHRKHIFCKLNISSQSKLFGLFLNHLIHQSISRHSDQMPSNQDGNQ